MPPADPSPSPDARFLHGLERNVLVYPVYATLFNALFWLPVFFLYFNSLLPLRQVLQLESLYYAVVVALEFPSGYFSDVAGRKRTLLIASAAGALSAVLFFAATDFWTLALGQVALATSIAFNSGSDTSFHYDSLALLNRESEFEGREAAVARNSLLGGAFAALLGGLAAYLQLRLAYSLSFIAMMICFYILLRTTEPEATGERPAMRGVARQVLSCLRQLANPRLAWLSAFLVFMLVMIHVPYEFYQPLLRLQFGEDSVWQRATPAVSGAISAAIMFLAAGAASASHRLRERWGLPTLLLGAAVLQMLVIGGMAAIAGPVVILLILLRSVPRGLYSAPFNAAIAPLIPRHERASFLSMLNLTGKLGFSLLLFGLAHAPFIVGLPETSALPRALAFCFALGVAGWLGLAASRRLLRAPAV